MGNHTKNADGLYQHYGTRDTDDMGRSDRQNVISFNIHGEKLVTDAEATTALKAEWARGAVIPSGAHIVAANLYVTEAFTSASSTAVMDIGTVNSETGAYIDEDGIDVAVTMASSGVLTVVGTTVACNGAQVNTASGGAALTAAANVVATFDTEAFTGGTARLELTYVVPDNG